MLKLLLSLSISVALSIVLVGIQILIESQQINKKVNRHFYNSNCLSAIGYTDNVLGCEGITNITRLNKINSKEFKVELFEFEFYKKHEGLSKYQVDYQIKNWKDLSQMPVSKQTEIQSHKHARIISRKFPRITPPMPRISPRMERLE